MANTTYTAAARQMFMNLLFKGVDATPPDLYISLYGANETTLVGERIYMEPYQWTLNTSSFGAVVTNTYELTFVGLSAVQVKGIALLDSSVGSNYLLTAALPSTIVVPDESTALRFAAGALTFSFNEV